MSMMKTRTKTRKILCVLTGILILGIIFIGGCVEEEPIKKSEKPIELKAKGDIKLFNMVTEESRLKEPELEFIATHYDLLIISFPPEGSIDKLRSYNPQIILLLYTSPHHPWGDKFWRAGNNIEEVEPDWLLRTEKGEIIYYGGPEYTGPKIPLLDIRKEEWQKYFTEQVKKYLDLTTMDGVLLDAFSVGYPPWAYGPNGEVAAGWTEEGWREAHWKLLNTLKDTLKEDYLIVYNGIMALPPEYGDPNTEFVDQTDGTCIEAYSVYLAMDENKDTKRWYFFEAIMKHMKMVVEKDKIFILEVVGDKNNENTRLYALSSFLLLQTNKTFFYFTPYTSFTEWYPEWEAKIGTPLGDYYQKDGVYYRDFSNAKILVNPGDSKITIQLDKTYYTLEGAQIMSITLKPQTGTILLKQIL
jgi:hypothetical protein